MKRKYTHDEIVEKIRKVNPNIEILGRINKVSGKVEARCKVDEYVWTPYVQNLLRGNGCPKCAGKQRKTTEEIKAELAIFRPDVEMLGEYHSAHEKIPYRFLECGHVCQISTAKIKSGRGCPECAEALRGSEPAR